MTAELQGKRYDTLADIYDASQRYGLTAQGQMQNQALSQFGALTGYQRGLQANDLSYLQAALNAQQRGQAYENAKVQAENQLIAEENQKWQNALDSMTSLGQMIGYAGAAKGMGSGVQAGVNDQLTQNIQNYSPQYAPWQTSFGGYYG